MDAHSDYMTWMMQMESGAEQQEVQMKPHIIDTAALYPPLTYWTGVSANCYGVCRPCHLYTVKTVCTEVLPLLPGWPGCS